ncbi:hypothetical protein [Pseudaestuariivita rosea]|uniref:hypothetical protein n=1 Tax=Pseudaestuariivita rosea TaxID=2763263 RepID=UPI001ABB7F71|nr:hypothetical protein [Pseudaestuariivita rosea]
MAFETDELAPGTHISADELNLDQMMQSIVSVAGLEMSREAAVTSLAGLMFMFGVVVACILKWNGGTHWSKVGVASVIMFFLSSPVWSFTLSGDWGSSPVPLLDQILAYSEGAAPLPRKMFALGLVMLMGSLSWPVFNLIRTVLMGLLKAKSSNGGAPTAL